MITIKHRTEKFQTDGGKISGKCIRGKINDYKIRSMTLDNIASGVQ